MRCDLKTFRECSCEPSECRAAPQTLAASVMVPSWKAQLAVCLFGGALTGIAFFGVMASQEGYQKKVDLDCQEACVTWK